MYWYSNLEHIVINLNYLMYKDGVSLNVWKGFILKFILINRLIPPS